MVRGLILILVALAVSGASPSADAGGKQKQTTQEQIAKSLERIGIALDKANEPKRETADCKEGGEDRKSDLCAQWKAADAASQAANAADETVTIGWVGVTLGVITMSAAIAAAIFAERAAHHAKASAILYRARERAMLVPNIQTTPYTVSLRVTNMGPTQAIVRIANSAIFSEIPNEPLPFVFPGFARMNVAVKEGGEFHFGDFDVPTGAAEIHAVGAIIYETVFGEHRLMRAAFTINLGTFEITPLSDLDWSLWEAEVKRAVPHS